MSTEAVWLVVAGVGAGLAGSVAGIASLASYPALLAAGLPPVTANVTNTVALFGVTSGTIAGSQRELRGQRRRVLRLSALAFGGGSAGAALLLLTPAGAFEAVVPWLVALGSTLLLMRDRIRRWFQRWAASRSPVRARPDECRRRAFWAAAVLLVSIYGGYFGAGVGILALAVLALERSEPLAVTNAVKNVATGTANGAAAIAYLLFAPVDWHAALALGSGAIVGGAAGPAIVRIAPEAPLRWLVGAAGLALSARLAWSAYL